MKFEKTPKTRAACWNCNAVNPTHLLPHVRLVKCPSCPAVLPGVSHKELNESGVSRQKL